MKTNTAVLLKNIKNNLHLIKDWIKISNDRRIQYSLCLEKIEQFKCDVLIENEYRLSDEYKEYFESDIIRDPTYDFMMNEEDAKEYCKKLTELYSNDCDVYAHIDMDILKTVEGSIMYTKPSIMMYVNLERQLIMLVEGDENIKSYVFDESIHDAKIKLIKKFVSRID